MKMLDWAKFEHYYRSLRQDIYEQPPDPYHSSWAAAAFSFAVEQLPSGPASVGVPRILDVGCGAGFMRRVAEEAGWDWHGVTLGEDYENRVHKDRVYQMDMSNLVFADDSFEFLFCRHVLEHSPFPILTLMEWHRVCSMYMLLVAPAPHYWGWRGKNHYAIAGREQLGWWLERSGWHVIAEKELTTRDELFLNHIAYYREALNIFDPTHREEKISGVLENYPPGPVEYWLVCMPTDEVTE
jgi:SAM-dependent methyltransferase